MCYLIFCCIGALVVDNKELCLTAAKFGSLVKLAGLLVSITISASDTILDWEDEEPHDTSILREVLYF